MLLFREEVMSRKIERLHGTIRLSLPVSWLVVTCFIFIAIFSAVLFLYFAKYSRTEIASGAVFPTGGILEVTSSQSGKVDSVNVQEGQSVQKGKILAQITAEQADSRGVGTQTEVLVAIDRQRRSLELQNILLKDAAASEQSEYREQVTGLHQEISGIQDQINVQEKLVEMARVDLTQANKVAIRGFISQRDLASRQETLLTRQQQLSVLRQAKAAKLSAVEQAQRAQQQAAAKASNANAEVAASQSIVDRDRAIAKGAQRFSLLAPADGRVTALNLHIGDPLKAQDTAMMIVPKHGNLIAQLYIPGKAVGFVHAGQAVRLAIDAYPFERFGTVSGKISIVSWAPISRPTADGNAASFYLATVTLDNPTVRAYGHLRTLMPGMTLVAHITVEHRSLLQWLFDPLFAAARND
jgi:membrane fusion protein